MVPRARQDEKREDGDRTRHRHPRAGKHERDLSPWAEESGIPGLVEYGGQLIFAVDFTPGGAPIGFPVRSVEAYLEGDFALDDGDDDLSDIDEGSPVGEKEQSQAFGARAPLERIPEAL